MNPSTAHAGAIAATGTRPQRPGSLAGVLFALVILCVLAAAALVAHRSADGAAPPATLAVIGETFDKGF
jgi:hypothetical protein